MTGLKTLRNKSIPIEDFDPTYLVFTQTPGLLRCLRPEENYKLAQGIHFGCPRCKDTESPHSITLLFKLGSVPERARPHGRWTWFKAPLSNVTLAEKIVSPSCAFEGFIACGKVRYRP